MPQGPRWAVPPPPPGAGRADLLRHAAEERDARHRIQNLWYELFVELRLVHHQEVPTAILGWVEPPPIGRVFLGPPTWFIVRPRPGLRSRHLVAVSDLLAAAFEVDAVEVVDFHGGWIKIVMVEDVDGRQPARATAPPPLAAQPASEPHDTPALPPSRVRFHDRPMRWLRGLRRSSTGPRHLPH